MIVQELSSLGGGLRSPSALVPSVLAKISSLVAEISVWGKLCVCTSNKKQVDSALKGGGSNQMVHVHSEIGSRLQPAVVGRSFNQIKNMQNFIINNSASHSQ